MLKRVSLALLLSLSTAGVVHAGTSSGQVDTYWTDTIAFYFKTTNAVTSKPACSLSSRFAVPLNTDFGRAVAAQVVAAKSSGLTLAVTGRNVCSTAGDSEDVQTLSVSGTPTTPSPAQYWATSPGDSSCSTVCSSTGGFAAANSSGQVCKGPDGSPSAREFRGNFYYVCGSEGNRTAQCQCYRR